MDNLILFLKSMSIYSFHFSLFFKLDHFYLSVFKFIDIFFFYFLRCIQCCCFFFWFLFLVLLSYRIFIWFSFIVSTSRPKSPTFSFIMRIFNFTWLSIVIISLKILAYSLKHLDYFRVDICWLSSLLRMCQIFPILCVG